MRNLGQQMMQETLDDVSAAVEYHPDHDREFSGDRLVRIVRQLVGENLAMKLRLMELEEIFDGSPPRWRANGEPIFEVPSGSITDENKIL